MAFTLVGVMTLTERMRERGLTDAGLAARIGCDRSMVTKIRHQKATPSLSLALAISRETGIGVAELLPASEIAEEEQNEAAS